MGASTEERGSVGVHVMGEVWNTYSLNILFSIPQPHPDVVKWLGHSLLSLGVWCSILTLGTQRVLILFLFFYFILFLFLFA